MSKFKLFIENFFVYGLGGIISKIIPLIMVPIVTRLMPSSDYFGISDMSNTIMMFAMYFAILGMYDAMYRLFFDRDDEQHKKVVCSTTLAFNMVSSLIVCLVMIILRKPLASFFMNNGEYAYIIYLTALATFVGATNSIVSAPTRMQNKRKVFLITNTISPILSYAVAIPMLINGYYLIALPFAGFMSGLINEIVFWILNKEWFSFKLYDTKILRELLGIGIPLLPNFLIYWVFNSCDRVMIAKLIGIGAAGIYAVGAKLGTASQLIYTAFAGGWQYFAFYTMNDEKQVKNNSMIFEYLGVISFASTFFICALAEPLYILLFEEEYHGAFIVSPYLFLAPLIQMLYQVAVNQFLVIKKTWPTMLILSSGAVLNVIINLILIPMIGIEGAAVATLTGYVIATVVCVMALYKLALIELSGRFYLAVCVTVLFMMIWRLVLLHNALMTLLMAIISSVLISILYRKDIRTLICAAKKK